MGFRAIPPPQSNFLPALWLVLGYGNAFGVESVQWGGNRGLTTPLKRFPGGGGTQIVRPFRTRPLQTRNVRSVATPND